MFAALEQKLWVMLAGPVELNIRKRCRIDEPGQVQVLLICVAGCTGGGTIRRSPRQVNKDFGVR